jgi:hypothetical protein
MEARGNGRRERGSFSAVAFARSSEEEHVPVGLVFENPSLSQEQYDALSAAAGAHGEVPGRLLHLAGPMNGGGWRTVEVWESNDAWERFRDDVLAPLFAGAGVQGAPPEAWQLHRIVTA